MRCWSEEGPFLCDPRTDGHADERRRNSRRRGVPGMSHGHFVLLAPGCEIRCTSFDTARPDLGSNVAVDDVKFWEWPRRTDGRGRRRIAQRSEGGGQPPRLSSLEVERGKKRERGSVSEEGEEEDGSWICGGRSVHPTWPQQISVRRCHPCLVSAAA